MSRTRKPPAPATPLEAARRELAEAAAALDALEHRDPPATARELAEAGRRYRWAAIDYDIATDAKRVRRA